MLRSTGGRNDVVAGCVAIRSLNPYVGSVSIRGRVCSKSPLRTWGGDGRVFSFVVGDATGEVRVCANEQEGRPSTFTINLT